LDEGDPFSASGQRVLVRISLAFQGAYQKGTNLKELFAGRREAGLIFSRFLLRA
jgi:hypothetical protein